MPARAWRSSIRRPGHPHQPQLRVVIEAGGQSHWVRRLLEELGHEVIVADPRRLKLISESPSKNDSRDARWLATFGLTCPKLLAPIEPRSEQTLVDRCALVRAKRW